MSMIGFVVPDAYACIEDLIIRSGLLVCPFSLHLLIT